MMQAQLFLCLICVLGWVVVGSVGSDGGITVETTFLPDTCRSDGARKTKENDGIILHYTGRLHDPLKKGPVFETSRTRGKKPLKFNIGTSSIIPGLSLGVVDMCIGERRRVIIPPELAYGKAGFPRMSIPGDATVEFDVELVGYIGEKIPKPNIFKEMDTNGDMKITYDEMEIWFQTKHPQKLQFIPRGVWEKDDKNQDFIITWEEFSGPKGEEDKLTVVEGDL